MQCSGSIIEKICIIIVYVMARSQQAKVAFVTIIVTCQSFENIIDTIEKSETFREERCIIFNHLLNYNLLQPTNHRSGSQNFNPLNERLRDSISCCHESYYSMFYLLHDDAVLK